jgi:hypothetical protein
MLFEPVLRDGLPRGCGGDELAMARTDARVAIQGSESHCDLGIGEWIAAEQGRAAVRAEELGNSGGRLKCLQQLCAAEQLKAGLWHPSIGG